MSNNELRHFKYVDKYKKNGKWIYVYPGENATKNAFGRVRGGTGGSLPAHQRLNREATNQVAKNSPSRNIPGAQSSGGKKLSGEQLSAARRAGRQATAAQRNSAIRGHRQALAEAAPKVSSPKNTVQTSKKQIRQGIRKAKVKTLKREAKKYISRAQSWLNGLFD